MSDALWDVNHVIHVIQMKHVNHVFYVVHSQDLASVFSAYDCPAEASGSKCARAA